MERLERVDYLTDGVFAIVATLLVLEVHVPAIPAQHTAAELWHSLAAVLPSLVAFAFSFLTILVYWVNHEGLSRRIRHYPYRLIWANLLLLLWITLIPFTTKFIAEYPSEAAAVLTYGLLMLITSTTATAIYCYVAFWSSPDLMFPEVEQPARKRLLRKWLFGPLLYLVAIIAALFATWVSIAIYIAIPLLFLVPRIQEGVLHDLKVGEHE